MEEPQEDERGFGEGGPPGKDGCRSRYFARQLFRNVYELLIFFGICGRHASERKGTYEIRYSFTSCVGGVHRNVTERITRGSVFMNLWEGCVGAYRNV